MCFLCVCMYIYSHVWGTYPRSSAWRSEVGCSYFETRSLTDSDRLAGQWCLEVQLLPLTPSTVATDRCCHPGSVRRELGIWTQASCLRSKSFIRWAVSPAPLLPFLILKVFIMKVIYTNKYFDNLKVIYCYVTLKSTQYCGQIQHATLAMLTAFSPFQLGLLTTPLGLCSTSSLKVTITL